METMNLFEELCKISLTPILLMTKDGDIRFANDSFLRLFDLSLEMIQDQNFFTFSTVFRVQRSEVQALSEGEEHFLLLKKRDVHHKPIHMQLQKLQLSPNQEDEYIAIQIRDFSVTNEKKEEIIQKMKQYKQFVKQSQDAFIVVQNERIQYLNPAGYRLLGVAKKSQCMDRSFFDFIHPDDIEKTKKRMERILSGSKVHAQSEVRIMTRNGQILSIDSSAVKIQFKEGKAIQYIMRDVTNRRKYDEMVSTSEKLTVVSKLAAGVAHEIRNPMTAIKGFIQLLQASKEYNEEYNTIMLEELNRVESIIHEFLTLAKPKQVKDYEMKSLQTIMRHVVLLLNTHASYNNSQILSGFEADDITIYCDENAIKQVFINLIQNALESMERGTVTIRVEKKDDEAVVQIRDEGQGIPKESLAKLGEPFFSTKSSGTGLGLMISYRIIEQHNGKMTFASEVGKGTTVTIHLPLQRKIVLT
ncbi:ATP-binding protein [Priestia koreensis]|uniref:histidine kinase n=1 Tax=Priestia koreensis TaxID=284581 RepID=A0A0M0LIJ3_9BACI|nr:ATP-binding protein [Priestia koreensis]KOO50801.1 histidine kinase [Priestia koreensis]